MRSAGRPDTTIYLRTSHIHRFARETGVGPWDADLDGMVNWLGSNGWAQETRRSHRGSLRAFYGWAHVAGRMRTNPAALLPPVKVPRGKPRPAPEGTYRRAAATARPREALMLRLAAHTGLRRAEVARVHTRDVEDDLIGCSLRVKGKGGRVRRVPLLDDIAAEIRSHPPGFVFPGQIAGHLSPAHVGRLVSRSLPDGWTAHNLRHRFAGQAYAVDRDIRAVQELLGHASVVTTQIYTPVPPGALRSAVNGAA